MTRRIRRRIRLWWHSDVLRHDGVYTDRADEPGPRLPLTWQCSCGARDTWWWTAP